MHLLDQAGDDYDRHLSLELDEDILDLHGGHGVYGDGKSIEAEDLRLVRQGSGNRQSLLLAS